MPANDACQHPEAAAFTRRRLLAAAALASCGAVGGCASTAAPSGPMIGSATSRNLFVDASQFTNRKIKIRLRNSSGEDAVDMERLRGQLEGGLTQAGYEVVGATATGFGIVVDANLYFLNSVAVGRRSASNEVGFLLGGVAGYELSKGPGGLSTGSGAIIGAVAGATLQEVLRSSGDYDTYLAICDVNIGIVRQSSHKRDSFIIGGNRFERDSDEGDVTFETFAQRETLKVFVYAGDRREYRADMMLAIEQRLARVVANLI